MADELTFEEVFANMVVEHNALISLLIEKGVIKEDEFENKIKQIGEEFSKEG